MKGLARMSGSLLMMPMTTAMPHPAWRNLTVRHSCSPSLHRLCNCSRKIHTSCQSRESNSKITSPPSSSAAPSSSLSGIRRIRNVGIIAHIDAGKTTTTERFLFYSGLTGGMGEVHDGDTVTDYMEQERERGITITSAAVTFPWSRHRVNLIDTPGHVDFTVEVERALSVLDSALVVLDASAGVEAQTVTVWSQADRHHVPRIVYLNKMDKQAADVDFCLKSIRLLGSQPLLLHHPIKCSPKDFDGIVDLVTMEKIVWQKGGDGDNFTSEPLNEKDDSSLFRECMDKREGIIASIADVDDSMTEDVLKCKDPRDIPADIVRSALRRVTIDQKVIPVLMGSSYKKVGVQPLMDAIIQLLPSPADVVKRNTSYSAHSFCGLAFKVIHHKMLGPLTFVRIYSGELKNNSRIFNVSQKRVENVSKMYIALADQFKEVPFLSAGNIVVVTGLECITGDTLVTSDNVANETPLLTGPLVPDPVFFCSVEAPSPSKQKDLEKGLKNLQREDPSLKVKIDDEGQIILSGMGELHIDIIKDRLRAEYDVEAFLGPLQVAYRESIESEVREEVSMSKSIAGIQNSCNIVLVVKPCDLDSKSKLKVIVTKDNDLGKLRRDHQKAIQNGIDSAFACGPMLNFPVLGVRVELHWFESTFTTTAAFISSVVSNAVTSALKKADITLLEPVMKLEISAPINHSTKIISDLSSRRSLLGEVNERNGVRYIESLTPLADLVNFSSALRSLSSGTATLSMHFFSYKRMTESEKRIAKQKVTGFS